MLAAGWTWNLMLLNKLLHLRIGPSVCRSTDINPVFCCKILDQLICAESLMALFAVHQRIREGCKMSGCDPGLRIHKDGAVDPDVILGFLDKLFPPCLLDVVFKLNTQISIVPGIGKTTIDLRARINKSS